MNINVKNKKLNNWIKEVADMCKPDDIYICNGSTEEYNMMMKMLLDHGSAIPLKKRPNSFLFRSDPSDVARVEDRTYISTPSKDEAGPTNNWIDPNELKEIMKGLYRGCMKGRTMFVIPFSMGPIGSPIAKIGVEISDSPYVVCNMHIMTRVSERVLDLLSTDGDFIPCLHSIGAPLEKDLVVWFRLWRQCVARQEMPRTPYCLRSSKKGRLDG
jgi:phosphoenolpyruvate carboxykinase (GTP)